MEKVVEKYSITDIRQKAEEIFRNKYSVSDQQLSDAERIKLYHELEVHQIELELQNEELLHSRTIARDAAQKYTELYEAAPASFFTLNRNNNILELNACASKLIGKKKDYILNTRFDSFVYQADQPVFSTFIETVFLHQDQNSCELRLHPEKNKNPIHVILTGILTERWDECLITALDITQQKIAVDVSIEKQRLSAIGEMASSIAHDFNNSLQSILGNLELAIHSSNVSNDTARYMKIMKGLITDAATRVHQLQRFGGNNLVQEQKEPLKVNNLIPDVIAQTRPLWKDEAEVKGIYINVKYEATEEAEIFGNKGELHTVLLNIIKNSIEAMPDGGLILIKSFKAGNDVKITITDTGTGMDEETRTRIFQPFYSTKGLDPGRGMGMSGVISIIKEHKGDVYVKNTAPGLGTTIEIKLPVYKTKKITEPLPYQDQKFTEKKENKVLNLLWVDDDFQIRVFVDEAVKLMGHHLSLAENGKEALQQLEKTNFDLVITDIGMPEMNGWQLADKIKEKYTGNMKIAVVSGWGNQIKEAELKEHGVRYILNKPFNLSQLNELLSNLDC